jgi:mono/diheme cytochrome c family protein
MKNAIRIFLMSALLGGGLLLAGVNVLASEGDDQSMEMARGANEWSDNCGQCHNAREPAELSDDQWHVVVIHMRIRANLTGQETRDILAFLQSSN